MNAPALPVSTQTRTTLAALEQRLADINALTDRAKAKLTGPATEETRRIVVLLDTLNREHDKVRKQIHNHPDSPPQG